MVNVADFVDHPYPQIYIYIPTTKLSYMYMYYETNYPTTKSYRGIPVNQVNFRDPYYR